MNMKLKLNSSFSRFVLVGIINTLVGTSIMFIAYNFFQASYWVSTFLNYFIGSIVSYLLNKYFTFKQKEKSFAEILLFIFNIALCYFIAYFLAAKIIAYLSAEYTTAVIDNLSMLVGMVLFVFLNYFGQRFVVFSRNK